MGRGGELRERRGQCLRTPKRNFWILQLLSALAVRNVTYEHRRRLEEVAERVVKQIDDGAGVQVGETNDLIGKERLPRTYSDATRTVRQH